MQRKLLIFDLDETLVYGTGTPLPRAADFVACGEFHVYKRPGVDALLGSCLAHFDTAVWTSAARTYAQEVVTRVFPAPEALRFFWTQERCTRVYDWRTQEVRFVKNLNKLKKRGYALEQVLVIDDSPEKHVRNYGNLIAVKPYHGEEEDNELEALVSYLVMLKDVENVREIDKRLWRERADLS